MFLKTSSLWNQVIYHKYIHPDSIEGWVINPAKSFKGGSIIWKVVVSSFLVIGEKLIWDIGNGRKLRIGEDPWVGCVHQHLLPEHTVNDL